MEERAIKQTGQRVVIGGVFRASALDDLFLQFGGMFIIYKLLLSATKIIG